MQLALKTLSSPGSLGCLSLTPDQDKCDEIYNAGDPQAPEQVCVVIVFNWHSWLESLGDYVNRGAQKAFWTFLH